MSDPQQQPSTTILAPIESEPERPSVANNQPAKQNTTRLRAVELGLVCFIVFSQLIGVSIYVVITGANLYGSTPGHAFTISGIFSELGALALLRYVLFRQGRTFADLGPRFSWRDVPRTVLVFVLAFLASVIWWVLLKEGYRLAGRSLDSHVNNVDLSNMVAAWGLLFLIINPFFEELIVRAYVISEIQFLTRSSFLAVIVSVVLQSSYHLYQGFVPALLSTSLFTVFSVYYIKTKRITPVVFAHMLFDFVAVTGR